MRLVTAWNPSPVYTQEYVDRLRERSSVPFEVIKETRWPGWWCKMGLFDPRIKGDFLYCDLDTVITGDITELAKAGRTMMLRDFFFPQRAASGVMFLTEESRARVWRQWIKNPCQWMQRFVGVRGGGDGAFLARVLNPRHFVQDCFPGQVCSFKVDCRQEPPPGVRMVCYHGNPRPHVTGWAVRNSSRWVQGVPAGALKCRGQGAHA